VRFDFCINNNGKSVHVKYNMTVIFILCFWETNMKYLLFHNFEIKDCGCCFKY